MPFDRFDRLAPPEILALGRQSGFPQTSDVCRRQGAYNGWAFGRRSEKQNPGRHCESGGIGRRAGLRIQSRKGSGFESPLSHCKRWAEPLAVGFRPRNGSSGAQLQREAPSREGRCRDARALGTVENLSHYGTSGPVDSGSISSPCGSLIRK